MAAGLPATECRKIWSIRRGRPFSSNTIGLWLTSTLKLCQRLFVRPDPSSITTLSLMLDCERRVRAALASMPCENQIAAVSACEETFGFHHPEQCKELLPPSIAPRIDAAFEARAKGTTIYLLDGNPPASV